jgi:transposase
MELNEAKLAVDQILHEECQRPTIGYEDIANEWVQHYKELTPEEIGAWTKITGSPRKNLWAQRKDRVRDVTETPQIYRFGGINYDLLMTAYGQLAEELRPDLMAYLLRRVERGGTHVFPKPEGYPFPSFASDVSELPLVAEFSIRTGHGELLFQTTAKAKVPTKSLAIMMIQLEETFALQWNLFSSDQLAHVYEWLKPLRETADKQTHSSRGTRGKMVENPEYKPGRERESNQIVDSIDRIAGYCQRGRFFYLKGTLQQNTNFEVENDKSKVEEFLSRLGFSADLMRALNEAEKDYRDSASPFELKNCLTHFRGFIEHLHLEAAQHIAKTTPDSTHDWDMSTSFLRKHDFITSQQEKLARGIYALISDEGVHPLMSERIFARVLRNVIIEYGFMFLTIMNGKGVNLTTP